ncbi:hypothetical protein ACIGO8_33465 [Streptomyces sp. NPDC053493]|uniref:hypothetical protein n=1 Tax=Streptomyces sp. NPDC053493 TaxID=3365705 RepID=UPI0037CD5FB3
MKLTYINQNWETGNTYEVDATVTVAADSPTSFHYTVKGSLAGTCSGSGVTPLMALQYKSSGESWKTISAPCGSKAGPGRTRVTVNGAGGLTGSGTVILRVGAYGGGGSIIGTWGWGEAKTVHV